MSPLQRARRETLRYRRKDEFMRQFVGLHWAETVFIWLYFINRQLLLFYFCFFVPYDRLQ
jgi:hypothetical protein